MEVMVNKLVKMLHSTLRLIMSTMKEVFGTLDNVNTAWREGKALDHFQMTFNDHHENGDIAKISVDPYNIEDRSNTVNVVIVTKSVPSRWTLFRIKRSMDTVNRRFGTHLTARIVQRPMEEKIRQTA
jgi:hypothetical protein